MLGVGVVYSGAFISAQRGGFERTSRIHYIAPEFVARQRVGRRWLFRESAGIGYGRYIRSYAGLTGSRGGVGIHESVSAEFMLTRFLGLGVTVGGQWLIVDSPDVDDGAELELGRHLPGSAGRRNPVLFLMPAGRNNCRLFNVVSFRRKQNS